MKKQSNTETISLVNSIFDDTFIHANKDQYRHLNYNGYKWYGYFDNLHHFSKGDAMTGFKSISCTNEMLNNGDIQFMALHDLSYNPKNLKT